MFLLLHQHDPDQCVSTARPRASVHVPESYGSPIGMGIYSGKSRYWRKLSGAYKVVKVSAQKAAQGAPRAKTVAVHRAIVQMGLHPQKCFLPVLPLPP